MPTPSTTIHAGYARYFSPPPFELIANETVQKFVEPIAGNPDITTTAAPAVTSRHHALRRARQLLRRRRRSRSSARASPLGVDGYCKLLQAPDRRGPVRRADHPDPVQLRRMGRQYGVELTAHLRQRAVHRLRQLRLLGGQGQGHRSPASSTSTSRRWTTSPTTTSTWTTTSATRPRPAPPTSGGARASAPT